MKSSVKLNKCLKREAINVSTSVNFHFAVYNSYNKILTKKRFTTVMWFRDDTKSFY